MSYLCRVELLGSSGWTVAHAGIALLDPERYVLKMRERGVLGRVSVLDDTLQPTDVYAAPGTELL